ncbi:dihydrofolate reductase [Sphingomonas sp. ASY06-1R]|uniref:dihydrofolate reductase n=1 Tax=Sphingomonas sp. ASY06-1R TaxID=3445771 RepID=UPI003FA2E045
MTRFTSIVSMNHQGAVGLAHCLPWRLNADLAFFRAATLFNILITDRQTYKGLGSAFLQQRINLIVDDGDEDVPDPAHGRSVRSVADAVATAMDISSGKDCFLVGAAPLYEAFAPFVDRYYITLVDQVVSEPEILFNLTLLDDADWRIAQHACVDGDGLENETGFSIFELEPRRPGEVVERRRAVLKKLGRARPRRSRGAFFRQRKGEGRAVNRL